MTTPAKRSQSVPVKLGSSLQLKLPLGQTVIIVLLFFSIPELLARLPVVQDLLPMPSFGGSNPYLDEKILLFNQRASNQLPLNCIFIGSSRIYYGFDPQVFQKSAGNSHDCFNFGIPGLRPTSMAILGKLLVQTCRPKILLVGIDDFSIGLPTINDVDIPWVRYRLGQFSANGFLIDHSYAYRYYLKLTNLRSYPVEFIGASYRTLAVDQYSDGFISTRDGIQPGFDLNRPVEKEDDVFGVLVNFQISPEQIAALQDIATLNSEDTQVIVILTTAHPSLTKLLPRGEASITEANQAVTNIFNAHNIPVWNARAEVAIPSNGWYDWSHLNKIGVPVFSTWVAKKMAAFEGQNSPFTIGDVCQL